MSVAAAAKAAVRRKVEEARAAEPVRSPLRPRVDCEIADPNCDRCRVPETITLRVTTSPNQRVTNLNVGVFALQAWGPIASAPSGALWPWRPAVSAGHGRRASVPASA